MIAAAVVVILIGGLIAAVRHMLGGRKKANLRQWAKGAYALWTGWEDSGTWSEERAAKSLENWYGATSWGQLSEVVEELKRGQTGNAAWDLIRAIDILRIGFAANYLDDEDCWAQIAEVGTMLQKQYPSWEALAQAFEAGMNAWQRRRGVTDPGELGRVQRNLPRLRSEIWPNVEYHSPLATPD